jgi:hypothetical protein
MTQFIIVIATEKNDRTLAGINYAIAGTCIQTKENSGSMSFVIFLFT